MGGEDGVPLWQTSPQRTAHTEKGGLCSPHVSPSDSSLLGEDSQAEVSLLVRLKGAGDEDVVSRG